jgi:tRNA threonylcarbamoyl adenosine modification protein YjeE
MTHTDDPTRRFELADETATVRLAWHVAMLARPGDVLALHGGLGSGKTSFARAFLRARAGDPLLEVPSPTFTLVQVYDLPGGAIWHLDLYRLAAPEEVWELGIEEAYGDAILLIEWAERLGALLPAERLDVELAPGNVPQARIAHLTPSPAWRARIATIPARV